VRCSTTDIMGVTSFTLTRQGPAVRLQWTARNQSISVFNVYRSGPGQPEWVFERINPAAIPFTNAPSYAYVAGTVEPGPFYADESGWPVGADPPFSVPLSVPLPPGQTLQLGILHPSPTEGSVSLAYFLASDVRVGVTVRDLSGRRVRRVVAAVQSAGPQSVTWDGSDDGGRRAPSGLYFIEVRAGNVTDTRRVALSR